MEARFSNLAGDLRNFAEKCKSAYDFKIISKSTHLLCLLKSSEVLKELFPLVAHADWSVRAEAVRVLAERRVRHAVPAILRRLETEQDEFVRDAIFRALAVLER